VILHTGGGGDLRGWQIGGYSSGLEGYRRILIDHRGHGASDQPREISAHRVEEYRDDVVALLDEVGERRAAFLGYSYGALVGCAVAVATPERVTGLIALDGLDTEDRSSRAAREANLGVVNEVKRAGLESLVQQWAKEEGYSGPEWFLENLSATDPQVFELALEASATWNGPAGLLLRSKGSGNLLRGLGFMSSPGWATWEYSSEVTSCCPRFVRS
jgi:pimeloyl-ACP methyl ester carboxylesterase